MTDCDVCPEFRQAAEVGVDFHSRWAICTLTRIDEGLEAEESVVFNGASPLSKPKHQRIT